MIARFRERKPQRDWYADLSFKYISIFAISIHSHNPHLTFGYMETKNNFI